MKLTCYYSHAPLYTNKVGKSKIREIKNKEQDRKMNDYNFDLDNCLSLICFAGIPDFAEVYGFIGSIFDPDTSDHVQKLKDMDPINFETVRIGTLSQLAAV